MQQLTCIGKDLPAPTGEATADASNVLAALILQMEIPRQKGCINTRKLGKVTLTSGFVIMAAVITRQPSVQNPFQHRTLPGEHIVPPSPRMPFLLRFTKHDDIFRTGTTAADPLPLCIYPGIYPRKWTVYLSSHSNENWWTRTHGTSAAIH